MKSIRTVIVEELKKLAEEIFHSPDDPWKQTLLQLIAENHTRRSTTRTQVKASSSFTAAT